MVLNYAQQAIGGAAAAGMILSDHLTRTAWYHRSDEHGSTGDYADALRDAAAADMFAVAAERGGFDAIEAIHQETRVPLLSDDQLDELNADIDYLPGDDDELTPLDDDDVAFVVPFADGLGLDWPDAEADAEPFIWAGSDMSDSEAPF